VWGWCVDDWTGPYYLQLLDWKCSYGKTDILSAMTNLLFWNTVWWQINGWLLKEKTHSNTAERFIVDDGACDGKTQKEGRTISSWQSNLFKFSLFCCSRSIITLQHVSFRRFHLWTNHLSAFLATQVWFNSSTRLRLRYPHNLRPTCMHIIS